MRAADGVHRIDADGDAEGPARGHDDPSGVLSLGLVQEHVGHDAITKQDEKHGAEEFREEVAHSNDVFLGFRRTLIKRT